MWLPLTDDRFGLMKTFSEVISRAELVEPHTLPDLHPGGKVITTSDYSGQHKQSRFECYSFLFANMEDWPRWEARRQDVRRAHHNPVRRLSFKKLGDGYSGRMLPDFLRAADLLPGLCVSVLIDKAIPSMFQKEGRPEPIASELAYFSRYRRLVAEKALRVVHLVSFFLAGLTRPGQDFIWFTDQDDIAADHAGVVCLTKVWGNILSHYLNHKVRHLRCGTTACDDGTRQIEDLAAIPDLAAGALVDAINGYASEATVPKSRLLVTPPRSMSRRARAILD